MKVWKALLIGLGATGLIAAVITNSSHHANPSAGLVPQGSGQDDDTFQFAMSSVVELDKRMRNPRSLNVSRAIFVSRRTICYEYRAQNGFGGLNVGNAIQVGPLLVTESGKDFRQLWNEQCSGRVGSNMADRMNIALQQYESAHNL